MKTLCYASCLVAILAGAAQAAPIAYEGVQYPAGALNLDGPAAGFSAAWAADPGVVVVAAGLSSLLALPVTGGAVDGSFNFVDPLIVSIVPSASKEFWASCLILHGAPNDQTFMGLAPPGTVLCSLPSVAIGVRLGQYGIFQGAAFTPSPKPFTAPGTTDFLVARFVFGGATWNVQLFVNKSSFLVPDLSLNVAPVTYGTMVNQNQVGFRSDEFRLGDTAADVAAGVVPALHTSWGQLKTRFR